MGIESVVISIVALILGGAIGFALSKKLSSANYTIYLEQAKAKARAIEHEAEMVLQNAKISVKEMEIEVRRRYEEEALETKLAYEQKISSLQKKEESLDRRLKEELELLERQKREIEKNSELAQRKTKEIEAVKKEYERSVEELKRSLSAASGLTESEAKELLLKQVEKDSRGEIAHIVRKYEIKAKEEGKKKANYILAQATTRFAGEFAAERLINVINLPDDELKGRIIGKEGRNIKTLEMVSGVDVIIDDTPNAIILSSFNLYRRAIATKTIELLVQDGRIQPARIEEVYEKVREEFEEKVLEEGQNIVLDLGLSGIHPELVKLVGKLKYRASYGQNALGHSLEVAHLASIMAAEMGGDEKLAKRAGLLHDIGKALTHEYSGSHVDLGADICKRYKEHPIVINAIYAHHGHEDPLTVECAAVCTADTLSAARPGARREVLESYLKRVKEIEEIAVEKQGVRAAYVINAGREVRVIVNADLINDDESILISKEIARDIEGKIQFPGEIKVNVIREVRAIEFAR